LKSLKAGNPNAALSQLDFVGMLLAKQGPEICKLASGICSRPGIFVGQKRHQSKNQTSLQRQEKEKEGKGTMKVPTVLYVANIIDYLRLVFLYWAWEAYKNGDKLGFAQHYATSYLLDALDGVAARALGQTSKLGYYLDMVIDRMSSSLCLHLAASQVFIDFDPPWSTVFAFVMYASLILVEVVAHGVVMLKAELGSFHQKEMKSENVLIRLYLEKKPILFWSCVSFEATALAFAVGQPLWSIPFLPGFIFRAIANLARLYAVLLPAKDRDTSQVKKE